MKIAFATAFDAQDVHNWSGTPFHMAKNFEETGDEVHYIGNLTRKLPAGFKIKQFVKKMCGQRESPRFNLHAAQAYSQQVAVQLQAHTCDVVLSPRINPIAFLTCRQPIVLWTDALYASLAGFYPQFRFHSAHTIEQGNAMTHSCLERCTLAIFSSRWAARTAMEIYGIPAQKVHVVPFGANLRCTHTPADIHIMLASRPRNCVRLLFIGKNWYRKGGDTVLQVAAALQAAGQPVEVNLVGCQPPTGTLLPSHVHCHGFVSKKTQEGQEKMTRLLRESHFLFVPSRAEAFGIVFCEASAFGLPSLATHVGGIPDAVRDHRNGKTFPLTADPQEYCNYIIPLMKNYEDYKALALSSFQEYETRLNWKTATKTVRELMNNGQIK